MERLSTPKKVAGGSVAGGGALVMAFLPDAIADSSRVLYSRIAVAVGLALLIFGFTLLFREISLIVRTVACSFTRRFRKFIRLVFIFSPLRMAAIRFVESVVAYKSALNDGGQTGFLKQRCSQLLREYFDRARGSGKKIHEALADEIEDLVDLESYSPPFDESIAYILRNWLVPVPIAMFEHVGVRLAVTHEEDAGVGRSGRRAYVSGRISIGANETLPQPLFLKIELDVKPDQATVYFKPTMRRTPEQGSGELTDVVWKGKTVWVLIEEPQLKSGDVLQLDISSEHKFNPPVDVQIATKPQVLDTAID